MNAESFVDTLPYNHPIWEDYQMSEWKWDHPYGVHTWDPTISYRHWKTHPVAHYLGKQTWVPTADNNPFEQYQINGNTIYIPKYTKQGDHWVIPKTSDFLNELQDQSSFLACRRARYQNLNNKRYTYRPKYPPLEYLASLKR